MQARTGEHIMQAGTGAAHHAGWYRGSTSCRPVQQQHNRLAGTEGRTTCRHVQGHHIMGSTSGAAHQEACLIKTPLFVDAGSRLTQRSPPFPLKHD